MNVVRKKNDKTIIMAGFSDFTGNFDANVYEQIAVAVSSADTKYKKWSGDNLVDMTQEEKNAVDKADNIQSLKSKIINLQKEIDACANLVTYTDADETEINATKDALIISRDAKIVELNNLLA